MITFPPGFVQIYIPGYFYNVHDKKLYTIKGGTLKELVKRKGFKHHPPSYQVRHNNEKITVYDRYLSKLKPTFSVILPTKDNHV